MKERIILLTVIGLLFFGYGWILPVSCKRDKHFLAEENWLQFKYDSRHSGNVPGMNVKTPLKLVGAIPLTDAIFTSPVISDGRVYIVDGSGVVFCIDASTLRVLWKFNSGENKRNVNNESSPAIAGNYLHVGTKAGFYYVLDKTSGTVIKKIDCGEPVFCTPVVANDKVYFATLSSRIYALGFDGTIFWEWNYLKERMGFEGNPWDGAEWKEFIAKNINAGLINKKLPTVNSGDQFLCTRDFAVNDNLLVLPLGGMVVWLEDAGKNARFRGEHPGMGFGSGRRGKGSDKPATFGLSIGENGKVYRQWHYMDNIGQVDIMQLRGDSIAISPLGGTKTDYDAFDETGFGSVSVRGEDVYRCRPQDNYGLCKHSPDGKIHHLGNYPSIAPPVLLGDNAIFGGLDGTLYIASLSDSNKIWSFRTAFGKSITAPVAVSNGRIYFGCDDGYLYILGPEGKALLPTEDLQLWKIRNPLTGKNGQNDHLRPEQIDHPLAGAN